MDIRSIGFVVLPIYCFFLFLNKRFQIELELELYILLCKLCYCGLTSTLYETKNQSLSYTLFPTDDIDLKEVSKNKKSGSNQRRKIKCIIDGCSEETLDLPRDLRSKKHKNIPEDYIKKALTRFNLRKRSSELNHFNECPIPGCFSAVIRVDDHLKNGLKSSDESYKSLLKKSAIFPLNDTFTINLLSPKKYNKNEMLGTVKLLNDNSQKESFVSNNNLQPILDPVNSLAEDNASKIQNVSSFTASKELVNVDVLLADSAKTIADSRKVPTILDSDKDDTDNEDEGSEENDTDESFLAEDFFLPLHNCINLFLEKFLNFLLGPENLR
nr:uncharacterized protein LOC124809552 [Hydra vulgaris]